jgi:hypothetical protein
MRRAELERTVSSRVELRPDPLVRRQGITTQEPSSQSISTENLYARRYPRPGCRGKMPSYFEGSAILHFFLPRNRAHT